MNLPASPTARRAEEMVRARQRMEALDRVALMERKLDAVILNGGAQPGGTQAPPPPATPLDATIDRLARRLGSDEALLPGACVIERRLEGDDEVAIGFTVQHLHFTIREAFDLGVLALDGRLNRSRLTTLLNATRPGWRPLYAASGPTQPRQAALNPRQILPST
jgi:hypothetical protein